MDILEHFYTKTPKAQGFKERKVILPEVTNLNLYGAHGVGKSMLILEWLHHKEDQSFLYLDLSDPLFLLYPLDIEELEAFVIEHAIGLLVYDHCGEKFELPLLHVEKTIVVSHIPLQLANFETTRLLPLDYEEFLAFESSHKKERNLSDFLRMGSLPMTAKQSIDQSTVFKNFFYAAFSPAEQQLLLILASRNTQHITTHQLYTIAKEHFKVSKDWLYKTMATFEAEGLLYLVSDAFTKSGKKLLLYDFAFTKYLNPTQPFIAQFENMIGLSFFKHNQPIKSFGIHGYLTQNNKLVTPSPFEGEESMWIKSQQKFNLYREHNIHKVTLVTVANSYSFNISGVEFEALPFDEWSIIATEE
jgi:hypothetical protein